MQNIKAFLSSESSEGESIQQPFLFFATDHSLYVSKHIPPPTDQQLQSWKMIRTSYDSLMAVRQKVQDICLATMPGGSYRIWAEGDDFVHRSFIDTYLFKSGTNSVGSAGKLRNLETIRSYTKAFFDKYLKDARSTLLDQNPLESSGISVDSIPRS